MSPTPKTQFILHACSRITFTGYLLIYPFLATFVSNSVFTNGNYSDALVQPAFWVHQAFAALTLGIYCLHLVKYQQLTMYGDRYMLFILLYAVSAVLSTIVNWDDAFRQQTIHAFSSLLMPMSISFVMVQVLRARDIRSVAFVFVAFGMLNVAFSFVEQVLLYGDLSVGPPSAIFTDRNLLARFLSIVHAFLLIEFLSSGKKKRLFDRYFLAMIPIFVCVTLLLSRSGYVVYLFVNAFIVWSSGNKTIRRLSPAIFCVLILLFSYMVYLRIEKDKMHIKDSSDISRLATWRAGMTMFAHSPLVGVGYGAGMSMERFSKFQQRETANAIFTIHNAQIAVLAEQGITGYTFYLLFNGGLLIALFGRLRRLPFAQCKNEMFCFVALAVFMIQGLFYHTFDYEGVYWTVIALCIIALRDGPQPAKQNAASGAAAA